MMHICFLTLEYPKAGIPHGGFGTFVKTIAKNLVKSGVRVSVVGVNYNNIAENVVEDGINIYRLKKHNTKGISWYLNSQSINHCLNDIDSKHKIDIVEASELGLAFIGKKPNIKYVIRLHGGHHFFAEAEKRGINKWKGFQEKRSFQKADAFIAVSEYVKKHTAKYLNFSHKRVQTINNPIDLKLFKPSENAAIIPFQIVFAGTVCEKKGVRELVKAFQLVKLDFPESNLKIYGRDWFYPNGDSYIDRLKIDFAAEDFIGIEFMGTVPHASLPQIYETAHVCVFPSHMETQGLVAPEAMAMGRPVIFTNLGPGPETIIDGETGFLVNPYNPNEIANKIGFCFRNPDKLEVISKKARVAVHEKFDEIENLKINLEFYRSLIA